VPQSVQARLAATRHLLQGVPALQKLLDDTFLIERYIKTPEFNGNRLPLWIHSEETALLLNDKDSSTMVDFINYIAPFIFKEMLENENPKRYDLLLSNFPIWPW
jgi:hypothetical protein